MSEQLELFQVLSSEQKQEVNEYVIRENARVVQRVKQLKRMIDLLIDADFVEDVEFKRNFEIGEETFERTFGWATDKYKHDVTVNTISGTVSLIHKRFYNGQLITTTSSVSIEGDKLMCTSITPQYRAYKPTTLREKLNEYNENQQWRFDNYNKKKSILDYTLDKYSKLYPNADVKTGTLYRGRSSAQSVLVSFPSGSWVELSLGFEKDKEMVHKKYDATVDVLKGMDLLNHFNKQS